MPRFYLHLLNDEDVPDEEGVELPDLDAARACAVQQARGMMGELLKTDASIALDHRIQIEDEDGQVLDTVVFGNIIKVEG